VKALVLALVAACAAPQAAVVAPASAPGRPTLDLAYDQSEVIEYMLADTPADGTAYFWIPCWTENAWFYLPAGPIVLCLELGDEAVFVAAHEAAHALIVQMDMSPDGPDPVKANLAHERAADDLATIFLVEMGREANAVEGAKWFMEDMDVPAGGSHPSHRDRAGRILCLLEGSDGRGSLECSLLYTRVWNYWAMQIATHLE
jgi:hypothetical protein